MNKKILRTLTIFILSSIMLGGCSSTEKTDNGFINTDRYRSEAYWESNDLKIISNSSVYTTYTDKDEDFEMQDFIALTDSQKKKVETLKNYIYDYFINNYNIDFSEKLAKQNVNFFSCSEFGSSTTMGYVDINDSDTLHLNIHLNLDYKNLFESTYVHETLHQLGFMDKECKTTFIVEGIVDAYTDIILMLNKANSQPTDIYFESRQLGYQIIAADKNLPNIFLEKKSFSNYLNDCLEVYTQPYEEHENVVEYLNTLLYVFVNFNSGTAYSDYAYFYAYDVQSIVQRFCQAQNCDDETIKYIRSHYLLEGFENLKIVDYENGSYSLN